MLHKILILTILGVLSLYGALPPKVQYKKDKLAVDLFLNQHKNIKVVTTDIDYDRHIIYFADNCRIYFKRQKIDRPPTWVGPAAPLIYSHSTCNINDYYTLEYVEKYPFSKIFFEFDSFKLRDKEKKKIKKIAKVLKAIDENIKFIRITGHTDAFGTDDINTAKGLKYADIVKNYLLSLGVNKEKVYIMSHGETDPLCQEDTVECHNKNRRVEIKVIW